MYHIHKRSCGSFENGYSHSLHKGIPGIVRTGPFTTSASAAAEVVKTGPFTTSISEAAEVTPFAPSKSGGKHGGSWGEAGGSTLFFGEARLLVCQILWKKGGSNCPEYPFYNTKAKDE